MSADLRLVDTNVLVYLFDDDSRDKQVAARELIAAEAERIDLSTQVLGEFYVAVTRKLARPLCTGLALQAVDGPCAFRVLSVTAELVQSAVRRSRNSTISSWKALIVETAADGGATVLATEDLQHGQQFGDLRVVNPFRIQPRSDGPLPGQGLEPSPGNRR